MKFVFTTTASCATLPKLPERTLKVSGSKKVLVGVHNRSLKACSCFFLLFSGRTEEGGGGRESPRNPLIRWLGSVSRKRRRNFPLFFFLREKKGFGHGHFIYIGISKLQIVKISINSSRAAGHESCAWGKWQLGCASIGAGFYGSSNWPQFSISITMRWCVREKKVTTLLLCTNGQNLVCPMLMAPLFFSRRHILKPQSWSHQESSPVRFSWQPSISNAFCVFCAKIACLEMSDFSSFGKKNMACQKLGIRACCSIRRFGKVHVRVGGFFVSV